MIIKKPQKFQFYRHFTKHQNLSGLIFNRYIYKCGRATFITFISFFPTNSIVNIDSILLNKVIHTLGDHLDQKSIVLVKEYWRVIFLTHFSKDRKKLGNTLLMEIFEFSKNANASKTQSNPIILRPCQRDKGYIDNWSQI